jgi:hypothetical protein
LKYFFHRKEKLTMRYVHSDIRTVTDGYIFQQCNCVTLKPHGLAYDLEQAFPGTCPYLYRKPARTQQGMLSHNVANLETPGTVFILANEQGPNIVNMFAQYAPGKPGNVWQPLIDVDGKIAVADQASDREKYFQECLDAMFDYFEFTEEKVKIAVPYKIGCGLAGGYWPRYEKMLRNFEQRMQKRLFIS